MAIDNILFATAYIEVLLFELYFIFSVHQILKTVLKSCLYRSAR